VRKNTFLTIFTLSFLLASLLSVTIVKADVPSVIQINVVGDKIVAEIRHASPSSSHYVETIEVRIDGEVYTINLDPQSEVVFEVDVLLNDVDLTYFEVRAKCISHGWSNWASYGVEEPTDDAGGIPGFPLLSVLSGVALVMLLQRTRLPALD
jgi:hypothetical protein